MIGVNFTQSGAILDGSAADLAESALQRRLAEAREALRDTIRGNAPVRTGEGREGIQIIGDSVVSTVDHMAFIEYGHVQGKDHPVHVAPHPFFFDPQGEAAAEAVTNQIPDDLEAEIG